MFQFTFGDVGSGKSLSQADSVLWLLNRSEKIESKYGLATREVWCNFHMSEEIQNRYGDRLKTWHSPLEMIFTDYPNNTNLRKSFDCVWDEIAVELPSDRWKDTDPEIRAFFAQHRKRGIQIFANTQDYMMVDINARRMVTNVYECFKLFGSRDPDPTLPPLNWIWGVIAKWELDKQLIRSDASIKKRVEWFPQLTIITEKLVNAYDTREDIRPTEFDVKHIKKICKICNYEYIKHV